MKSLIAIFILCSSFAFRLAALETVGANTIYDPDPKHLWNRLNETLFDRTAPDGKHFGLDQLDILYWYSTTNLLFGPSHERAIIVMDEFIHSHGEKLISDPLKRALLQRDLWELFDWSAKYIWRPDQIKASRELQPRIVKIIRRLALTTNEIAALPDNYAQSKGLADLPRDLFNTNGDWVSVGINGYNEVPVAPTHLHSFGGHSAFCVMLHAPTGRKAGIAYLDALRVFAQDEHVWVYESNRMARAFANSPKDILVLNSNIPQPAVNTEWALVRRMCVIDTEGRIQPTPIIESIQMRRYLSVDRKIPDLRFQKNDVQKFFEFQMDKQHGARLRAMDASELDFSTVHFMGKGIDWFERNSRYGNSTPYESTKPKKEVLMDCYECHSSRGIFSVLSYRGFIDEDPARHPADLAPIDFAREGQAAIYWKQTRYDWGLLEGLWRQED